MLVRLVLEFGGGAGRRSRRRFQEELSEEVSGRVFRAGFRKSFQEVFSGVGFRKSFQQMLSGRNLQGRHSVDLGRCHAGYTIRDSGHHSGHESSGLILEQKTSARRRVFQ